MKVTTFIKKCDQFITTHEKTTISNLQSLYEDILPLIDEDIVFDIQTSDAIDLEINEYDSDRETLVYASVLGQIWLGKRVNKYRWVTDFFGQSINIENSSQSFEDAVDIFDGIVYQIDSLDLINEKDELDEIVGLYQTIITTVKLVYLHVSVLIGIGIKRFDHNRNIGKYSKPNINFQLE